MPVDMPGLSQSCQTHLRHQTNLTMKGICRIEEVGVDTGIKRIACICVGDVVEPVPQSDGA